MKMSAENVMVIMAIACSTALMILNKINENIFYDIIIFAISYKVGVKKGTKQAKRDLINLPIQIDIKSRGANK